MRFRTVPLGRKSFFICPLFEETTRSEDGTHTHTPGDDLITFDIFKPIRFDGATVLGKIVRFKQVNETADAICVSSAAYSSYFFSPKARSLARVLDAAVNNRR